MDHPTYLHPLLSLAGLLVAVLCSRWIHRRRASERDI